MMHGNTKIKSTRINLYLHNFSGSRSFHKVQGRNR